MRFTDLFIRRPVLSIVVSLLILLLGLRSFFDLPVRQYPRLDSTVITITTVFPGAAPEIVQGFITQPIEQAVASTEGIDYMTSSSTLGASVVTVNIVLGYDAGKAMTDVLAKANQVRYLLPKEAFDPAIVKSTGQPTGVMYLSFSSETLGGAAIADYLARTVQPLLATVDGVASADILGGQTFAMRLWLDPIRMAAFNVTASEVAAAILANNYQAAPGQAKGYFTIANISADTDLKSVDQFREMVVKAQNGALVKLRDVADVDLGPQSTNASVVMNGQHSVFVGVNATPEGNPLNIVSGVTALLPSVENGLPPSIKMHLVYDSTKFIRSSIHEVETTLGTALVIVIVVIFLFLGTLRSVVIPVVTIPLSLIGAGMIMLAMGFSFNLLTLLAMVLAIGLVVDDAIVVVENVYRHIEHGKGPLEAAFIGAREILGPIIAMTITLAAVYAPIGFLSGLTGTLFREFAFTLAGAVIISGIVAITLSPMMCSRLLTANMNDGWFARRVERFFAALTRAYGRRLASTLNYRPIVALFAVGVFCLLAFFWTHARDELAPPEDQGFIIAVAKGPQYANLNYTESYGDKISEAFRSFPETDATFIINGTPGLNQSLAGLVMKPWDERKRSVQTILPMLQGKLSGIAGMNVFAVNIPALPGSIGGLPVQMAISAPSDFETLYKLSDELKNRARKSGLFIVVDNTLDFNNPVIQIHVDREKANDLGITMQSVGQTLALMVGGNYINLFDFSGRSYQVIPQVPRSDRLTPETLTKYYVRTASGSLVPLSSIVTVSSTTQPNALTHFNQLNSSTFGAVPMPGVTQGDAVAFLEKTAAELLPADYHHQYLSDSRQYVQEGSQLVITFVFAIIIIYLVLAAQFESLRDPLVILVSVPMAICGALLPLFIGVATRNIYTEVGLVTLIGLISKHGILMTEFANQLQRLELLDRRAAIERAAAVRLRPILMTTAAMVVGLVPLIFATGAGAASRFNIGIVIVSGMLIGTLFTLFILPTVYTVLAKDHRKAMVAEHEAELAAST